MERFQIKLVEGHPIIKDGENLIFIDTGAPSTIHTSDNLTFCSNHYDCSTNYLGLTASSISKMLGTEITTLLGTDVLSDFKILFDYRNGFVEFSREEIEFDGVDLKISSFMGVPIMSFSIANQMLNFFLDTGAKLSYLPSTITQNYESIGTDRDFYPGIGEFETNCFEIPTSLGGQGFIVKYGNLPTLLQMTLTLAGADGIIGFDFFNNFTVLLDLENNKLKCKFSQRYS